MPTLKPLPRPVALPFDGVDMQALSTRLGCVGGVYQHRLNTVLNALVGNKAAQLIECPTIRATAFRLVSGLLVRAVTNTCQIFQRDRPALGFSSVDNVLADVVVHPGLVTPLSAHSRFKIFLARLRVDLVPFDAFFWSDALTLENLSLAFLISEPDQLSPSEVTAMSVRPKSTPITLWAFIGSGASSVSWICR